MLVLLGWMLLAGLPLNRFNSTPHPPHAQHGAARRVSVWTDRDEPYARGDGARVYLSVEEPSYLAVFRVDTDGRIRVLFPREPWNDTYVRDEREFEVAGPRDGGAFVVDDDPGVGYLFAIASADPLDFRDITRGNHWDYRPIGGGRIQGDPYVALTDLAARVSRGEYDYDISPYYVNHHYDYPRFVCYDCHAYASYSEWDPYRTSCTRYRVVVRDDPRYYPYRYGGRNVVTGRLAHPGPRFVFRDADPGRPSAGRAEPERRLGDERAAAGRTSADIGGQGAVPAPVLPSLPRAEPPPGRPAMDDRRPDDRRPDERRRERPRERNDSARDTPEGLRPTPAPPRSTGEPELRRRRP